MELPMLVKDLREAYRQFTTGVALITTHGRKGPNVMAAEWTFNVSYDPFLISVHLDPGEATHEAIVETGEFGVNMVAEDQVAAMAFAGHFSKYDAEKLSSELFDTYPGARTGVPMIRGCLLNAECRVVQRVTMGDHTAFVGEVLEFSVDNSKRPVVLHRGARRVGPRVHRRMVLAVAGKLTGKSTEKKIAAVGELMAPRRAAKRIRMILLSPEGSVVSRTEARTGAGGDFTAEFRLPGCAAPGVYTLVATYRGAEGRARVPVK